MKNVLITGASTGIGAACALWLEEKGHRVFAGVRKASDGENLRHMAGANLIPVVLDVTEPQSIQAALEAVGRQCPQLDGLVNNAGVALSAPVEFLALEDLRRILEVNTVGQVAVTQAFLPLLRPAKGRIAMMSSISGKVSAPFFGAYSASKFALEALSDSLRRELRPWGIWVSVIEPGNIKTPIWNKGVDWGEQMKKDLPARALELYGPTLDGVIGYVRRQAGIGANPNQVAQAVEHALTSARPRTRYAVGRDAQMAAFLLKLLPDGLVDAFFALTRLR